MNALAVAVLASVLVSAGCSNGLAGVARKTAANAFDCADYALTITEVGPDIYRASGCGQELIYACKRTTTPAAEPDFDRGIEERGIESPDQDFVAVCTRRPE